MNTIHKSLPFVVGLLLCSCGNDQVTKEQVRPSSPRVAESQRTDTQSNAYTIQKGDQAQISVLGYSEFDTVAPVKETGTITVPLIGEVIAAGLTREQLTQQIISRLSDYVKSTVYLTLTITGVMAQKVVVLGAVAAQGSYAISAPVSPFQILAAAGGPSADADLRHIKIFHNSDTSQPTEIDISNPLLGWSSGVEREAIPLVSPGDLFYVPREENVVREFSGLLRDVLFLFGVFAIVR
jgi:protein involved in polysaccharide export with SLBB domain